MKSEYPKVLHEVLGYPLIYYSLCLAGDISTSVIAVVGHGRDRVIRYLESYPVKIVVQEPQLGTGHAILMAKDALQQAHASHILILPGDMPLIRKESLKGLLDAYHALSANIGVLTARIADASGYGRIVRDRKGTLKRIVEHNDATRKQLKIDEINTGVYVINKEFLLSSVKKICPDNTKGEFYLTDVVAMAPKVVSFKATDPDEAHGINSRDSSPLPRNAFSSASTPRSWNQGLHSRTRRPYGSARQSRSRMMWRSGLIAISWENAGSGKV